MKKHITGLCMAAAVCLLLCGCGSGNAPLKVKPSEAPGASATAEAPASAGEDPGVDTGGGSSLAEEGYGDAGGAPSPALEAANDDAESRLALAGAAASGDIVDVTEKMYVPLINDIYTNTPGYLGKTIRIEGMFTSQEYNGKTYYFVYRVGPGCCGNDGNMCGFEFTYDGGMPKDNDWIEVVGELTSYEEEGYTYLSLNADMVTVKTERGKETVK
jgi:hypothetical protein